MAGSTILQQCYWSYLCIKNILKSLFIKTVELNIFCHHYAAILNVNANQY